MTTESGFIMLGKLKLKWLIYNAQYCRCNPDLKERRESNRLKTCWKKVNKMRSFYLLMLAGISSLRCRAHIRHTHTHTHTHTHKHTHTHTHTHS